MSPEQCPYCKAIGTRKKHVICTNCRNYADALILDIAEREERELFKVYRTLPWNWRDYQSWRDDPYYKR